MAATGATTAVTLRNILTNPAQVMGFTGSLLGNPNRSRVNDLCLTRQREGLGRKRKEGQASIRRKVTPPL